MALLVRSLKDQVRDQLKQKIITCQFMPGQRIIETEIARNLGISQAPVREAIRSLEAEGLIVSVKNKGSFVAEIDETELYHIQKLRAHIESSVLELVFPLSKSQSTELYELIKQMETASHDSDYEAQSRLDVAFHSKVIEWSQVDIYIRVWNTLTGHIQRFIAFKHPMYYKNRAQLIALHQSLINVWSSADLQKAKDATVAHAMLVWIKSQEITPTKKT